MTAFYLFLVTCAYLVTGLGFFIQIGHMDMLTYERLFGSVHRPPRLIWLIFWPWHVGRFLAHFMGFVK